MNAAIRALARAQEKQNRLSGGAGVRLYQTRHGTRVRFQPSAADFGHPWLVGLVGTSGASVLPGFINRVPGTVNGVPLAGAGAKPPPVLKWTKLQLTEDGIGYVAAEVTCNPKDDFKLSKVEIVQVADLDTDDGRVGKVVNTTGGAIPLSGNRARWALAMLQRRESGLIEVFQITFFDLTHGVKLAADGVTISRHFFW